MHLCMVVLSLGTSQKDGSYDIEWWQKCEFQIIFLPTFQLKTMEVNVESPLYSVNHDLEENVEEEVVSNSTIQLTNVVEDCLDANVEAPTSSFVHGQE